MKKGTMNIWKYCFIIACVVIVVLAINLYSKNKINNDSSVKANNGTSVKSGKIRYGNQDYSGITLEEDLSIFGEIENLEDVRFDNVRISQYGGNAVINITISNDNPEKKIEDKQLKIELLDIDGNVLAEGNGHIEELSKERNYANIDFTTSIPTPSVVFDIRIVAE